MILWKIAIIALLLLGWQLQAPALAQATKYYAPPLSYSNADLNGKDFSGENLQSAELSNCYLQFTNFENAQAQGAIFSLSVMTEANLHGADLTNSMLDQVDLTGADLTDAILVETILLGSQFESVKIAGADFSFSAGSPALYPCLVSVGMRARG
ncbi:pentapeptide repeat-containing protein, partial [Phormidium sp. CCY1219]|uniref:pentapeptide repeat-containing protein n=1 Tax=Phormidium sp. CCY1219 TaxID=2886104 RepID=UPI002D1E7D56